MRSSFAPGHLHDRGLADEGDIRRWMEQQSLDEAELGRLLQDQAESEWAERLTTVSLEADMLDTLKLDGTFASWSHRARSKTGALGEGPARSEAAADQSLPEWYLTRLALPVPVDLQRSAGTLGLGSVEELTAIIERERRYEALSTKDTTAPTRSWAPTSSLPGVAVPRRS